AVLLFHPHIRALVWDAASKNSHVSADRTGRGIVRPTRRRRWRRCRRCRSRGPAARSNSSSAKSPSRRRARSASASRPAVGADALAAIPDELGTAEAAPLLCAGVTTFNALRHSGAMPGDVVAILGIGGLGHLGVQFANKLGFRTVAIARGADKEALSRKLGAHHFIDNATEDVAAALNRLGGARAVLATVTSAKAMTPVIDGLAVRGRLIVVGVDVEPLEVSPLQLIGASRSIVGHAAGASIDSQDTLVFSALSGVRPMIETMPLSRAPEAYARMMRAEARFRMVLTMAEQH